MEIDGRNMRQAVLNSLLLKEVMDTSSSESEKDDENDLDEPEPEERPNKRSHELDDYRPQKRSKQNGSSSGDKESKGEKKRKRQPEVVIEETGITDLMDVLKHSGVTKHGGKVVEKAASSWVSRYDSNPDGALRELLTVLFQACGVKSGLEDTNWNEIDVDDAVHALVGEAKDMGLEDYLGSKQRNVRNFKHNLISFWDCIIKECQDGVLFDQKLMEKIMDYVIALSCTVHRLFRRVATLVGCQLVTSLVGVGKALGESRETTQRQLNAEKKKRKDGLRMETLIQILSETHAKITTVEEMMRKLFTGLFMHRYRDVDPEIRMACISAIGLWIYTYPSMFLQDLYMKYIGWTLNDKNASVRRSSLVSLQALYAVDDNIPFLGLFTERFSSRIIELADDIDVTVAVSAIALLKQLLRHGLLEDDELGSLYELLIDESPEIRHAVGDLVYDHLIAPAAGKDNDNLEGQLERLLQILREFSGDPILCDYVIDALWDKCKAMKDWKCMTNMLLDDRPGNELNDREATNLVRVLSASVKKAVGKKIVSASGHQRMSSSKAQKELLDANMREMTLAMIKSLTKVLTKYLVDQSKIAALVSIILHMKLELYSLNRKEQNFTTALQLIKDAFFKHGESNILKACITSLAFAATESHADLQNSAQQILKEAVDDLTSKLKLAIGQAGDSEDDYSLTVNLKRMYEIQSAVNVYNDGLFLEMLNLLEEFSDLDQEVARLIYSNLFLHVTWLFTSIDPENPDDVAMDSLLIIRNRLMQQLYFAMETMIDRSYKASKENLLNCTVCFILSDIWTLFSEAKLAGTKLMPLGFCPPEGVVRHFWKLCENRLLSQDDDEDDVEATEGGSGVFLNEKHMIMAAAVKLFNHFTVPLDFLGPEILSHYVLHGNSVARIVEDLIPRVWSQDDASWAFLESMKRAYERHLYAVFGSDEELSSSPSFTFCKDLANRLSNSKVIVRIKHVVQEGIDYAFIDAPRQLSFLECGVIQFALKLPLVDVIDILADIEPRVEGVDTDQDPSGWRPFFNFVDVLQEKCAKHEIVNGHREGAAPVRQIRKPMKQKVKAGNKLFDGHDSSSEELENEHLTASEENDHRREGDDEDDNTPLFQIRQSVKTGKRTNIPSRKRPSIQYSTETPRDISSPSADHIEFEEHEVGAAHASSDHVAETMTATEEQLPAGNHNWLSSGSGFVFGDNERVMPEYMHHRLPNPVSPDDMRSL